jgi:small nuclear ribonucleoprotein (snRNP)-like protein
MRNQGDRLGAIPHVLIGTMNLEVVIGVVNGYDALCNMQYNLLIHIKI